MDFESKPDVMAFAAAIYTPKNPDRKALLRFIKKLSAAGVCVAGILQEMSMAPDGIGKHIDAIDITTGRRIPIKRPMKDHRECGLDVSALVETSTIILDAINDHPDLIVIEKFGSREQRGKGMCNEVFQAISAEIPLLIAVPESSLASWQQQSGGLGSILPFKESAFHAWWHSVSPK